MNILILLRKTQKHENWLFKESPLSSVTPHVPNIVCSHFCPLENLKCHVPFTSVLAYSMWILYVLLIEWVSMYLSVSFCLFPFSSDLGQSIFYTTTCLLPFLSDDILSTLPYTMISTLATFPPFLHKDIIEYLSTSFLPMAICEYDSITRQDRCFFY